MNEWINKMSYNGILFSLEKKLNSDIFHNMDEPQRQAQWNKLGTNGQILYDPTYMRYLKQLNSWQRTGEWLPGVWRRRQVLFKEYRASVWIEKNLEREILNANEFYT